MLTHDQWLVKTPLALTVSAAALLMLMGADSILPCPQSCVEQCWKCTSPALRLIRYQPRLHAADYVAQNSPPSMSFRATWSDQVWNAAFQLARLFAFQFPGANAL